MTTVLNRIKCNTIKKRRNSLENVERSSVGCIQEFIPFVLIFHWMSFLEKCTNLISCCCVYFFIYMPASYYRITHSILPVYVLCLLCLYFYLPKIYIEYWTRSNNCVFNKIQKRIKKNWNWITELHNNVLFIIYHINRWKKNGLY